MTSKDGGALSDERGAGIHPIPGGIELPTTGINPANSNTTEIELTEALRIDLASGLQGWQVRFNSLDPNEVANVYTGSVSPANLLGTVSHVPGTEFEFFNIPNAFASSPVWVTGGVGDVLVYGVAAIPEPTTLLLLGLGLFGVGLAKKRKANS